MDLKKILPSKIFEVIDKAGLSTAKQIMILSVWDIKKLTNLRTDDILLLKNQVANHVSPESITSDELLTRQEKAITTGCVEIDKQLQNGFRVGTITEIYGESGSGKTQIALQAAAHNWSTGTVFICTEDTFPVKRFEQIKQSIKDYNREEDYGKNIFVEHITEACDLLSCIRVRLPKLLEKHKLSLVIIDSIAAPFRSEYTNYIQRAEELRELALSLIKIAQEHNLAVLCINQVTASFDGPEVLPSLGLAWSNMISTRLWLRKTNRIISFNKMPTTTMKTASIEENIFVRELSVIFAPNLPNSVIKLIITPTGIQSML
ncbi:DNA repair protein XRCC3 [Pectinophora gossypiella]|uniref:DNA repair protein XRCC3 n=1 Tax=Pectinophora gossypiella TaxID=13191 RepID=UPI00214ECBCA|nr:DNA repair protein XRCC3 [Pectinophora gossypiella]